MRTILNTLTDRLVVAICISITILANSITNPSAADSNLNSHCSSYPLCDAVDLCNLYRTELSYNSSLFETVVRNTENNLTRKYCQVEGLIFPGIVVITSTQQILPCEFFGMCPEANTCAYYNNTYKDNKTAFEDVVRNLSNDVVRNYCEFEIGLVMLDGTVVAPQYN